MDEVGEGHTLDTHTRSTHTPTRARAHARHARSAAAGTAPASRSLHPLGRGQQGATRPAEKEPGNHGALPEGATEVQLMSLQDQRPPLLVTNLPHEHLLLTPPPYVAVAATATSSSYCRTNTVPCVYTHLSAMAVHPCMFTCGAAAAGARGARRRQTSSLASRWLPGGAAPPPGLARQAATPPAGGPAPGRLCGGWAASSPRLAPALTVSAPAWLGGPGGPAPTPNCCCCCC